MDIALWILGCWFALSIAVGLWVAAFIRQGRGLEKMIPLRANVTPPDRGAPRR